MEKSLLSVFVQALGVSVWAASPASDPAGYETVGLRPRPVMLPPFTPPSAWVSEGQR